MLAADGEGTADTGAPASAPLVPTSEAVENVGAGYPQTSQNPVPTATAPPLAPVQIATEPIGNEQRDTLLGSSGAPAADAAAAPSAAALAPGSNDTGEAFKFFTPPVLDLSTGAQSETQASTQQTVGADATATPQPTADDAAATTEVASENLGDGSSVSSENTEGAGIMGKLKEKVGNTVQRVSEMETVKKVTEHETVRKSVDYVVDTSKVVGQKVADNEKVQKSVQYVKQKTTEIAESERFQKGVEAAKDTAKVVAEKTQQGVDYAKEKTKAAREGVSTVWSSGRGSITRVRAEVGKMAWKGSARDTLDMAARDEQWKDIKVQGAEELTVPARTEHTSAYHVSKGSTLRWTFRVKEHDIGFGVRMRVQQWGGAREDEVLAVERYDSVDTISGSWVADEDRTMVLAFDNKYSKLRGKTVAYIVGTEKPPVFTEPIAEAASSSHQASVPAATNAEPSPPVDRPIV